MNNFPLISVIIPVYNAEQTIMACLNSILKQDYPNFEVILIDDGSTDASFSVCKKFADANDNVFVYQFENAGAAEARNRGIKEAHGKYIAFVDSDDIILPGYLTYLYGLIEEYRADVAACGYKKYYNAGNRIAEDSKTNRIIENSEMQKIDDDETFKGNSKDFLVSYSTLDAVKNLLYQRHFISAPWAMLSKKSLWDNVSFPKGKRAEDMATIYRLFAEASSVAYGSSKQYIYVQSSTNTVFSTQSVLNPYYYEHCLNMVDYIKNNMPEALPAAKSRLFSACFQIMSETSNNGGNRDFVKKIYGTIKDIRKDIIKDSEGKPRNRIAATLSYISIKLLHVILRMYYRVKMSRL